MENKTPERTRPQAKHNNTFWRLPIFQGFYRHFERIKLPLWFYSSWADNLYNNNIYIYINIYKAYNNLQRGRPALSSHGVTLRWAGHYGQARNMVSSFQFWVLPIPASRPMPSGHFMCMALPPTERYPTGGLDVGASMPK